MEKEIGEVIHFYGKLSVAIVKLSAPLKKGEKVHIKGHTSDFEQEASEIQLDHKDLEEAGVGDEIGLKVNEQVREGDKVYLAN